MITFVRLNIFGHHNAVDQRLPLNLALIIGAIGVVYGDIGTSPLYAVNQVFFGIGHTPVTRGNVLGVIGLIFWLLTLVVTCKYIFFVLRASYQGEGGVFALHELVATVKRRSTPLLLLLLVFAASLLLGDGMITPAISVISAVDSSDCRLNSHRSVLGSTKGHDKNWQNIWPAYGHMVPDHWRVGARTNFACSGYSGCT
jgi:K+ transporter